MLTLCYVCCGECFLSKCNDNHMPVSRMRAVTGLNVKHSDKDGGCWAVLFLQLSLTTHSTNVKEDQKVVTHHSPCINE